MEEYSAPSLESLFNGTAVTSEPTPPTEPTPPEPTPAESAATGEPNPTPPVEEPEDPKIAAFKAKAIDEGKKRQKLEQDFAELQRQNAEYQRYVQQVQAQQRAQQQVQQQPKPQGLQPQDFQTYEAFLEAVAEQKATAKAQEIFDLNMRRAIQAQQQADIQQQTATDLAEMLKAGSEKYPDFQNVVGNQRVLISDPMMNAMLVLDGGHEVAYFLGQNPAESARIYRLPPSSQAREIGKIARQITAPLQPPAVVDPVVPAPQVPAPAAPELPKTLTQTRSAGGQFAKTWTGPTPLDQVIKRK
jgi:hypothetical protein